MSILQEKFKEIADEIRTLTGWTHLKIKPKEFRMLIGELHEAALMQGHEIGAESEYANFWNTYQQKGKRTNWTSAFYLWDNAVYKPKYDISGITFTNCFGASTITDTLIPVTILTGGTSTLQNIFYRCRDLVTVRSLHIPSSITKFSNCFQECTALENLTISGVINGNGFDVHESPKLSKASLLSILNALANKSQDANDWVLTLGETNLNKLSATEIAIATEKGWSLV